jgi:hypothetical protein
VLEDRFVAAGLEADCEEEDAENGERRTEPEQARAKDNPGGREPAHIRTSATAARVLIAIADEELRDAVDRDSRQPEALVGGSMPQKLLLRVDSRQSVPGRYVGPTDRRRLQEQRLRLEVDLPYLWRHASQPYGSRM